MIQKKISLFALSLLIILLNYPARAQLKLLETIQKKAENKELVRLDEVINIGNVPPAVQSFFRNIAIAVTDLDITTYGFEVAGKAEIYHVKVDIALTIKNNGNKSFKLALPSGWKFSDTFKTLQKMDNLKIHNSYFIISNYNYRDEVLGLQVTEGLNFSAGLTLTDAVEKLKTLIDKILKPAKFIVAKKFELRVTGIIPHAIEQTNLSVAIPAEIGIDFEELFKLARIKVKPLITRFYTSDLRATISAQLSQKFSGGFIMELSTQKEPLEFRIGMEVETVKQTVSVEGQMVGILKGPRVKNYKNAFGHSWLEFGDFGVKFGINPKTPETLFISNLALKGTLSVANIIKDAKAMAYVDIAGGQVVIDASAKELSIDQLIILLAQITKVAKVNIKGVERIPLMRFYDLKLTIAPMSATIFDIPYSEGINASGDVQIDKIKGSVVIGMSVENLQMSAQGKIDPIDTPVFKLTGVGPDRKYGTKDDCAILDFLVAANVPPDEQKFVISADIEIPPIGLRQKTDISFEAGKLSAEMLTTLFGSKNFKGEANIKFDTRRPDDFTLYMSMDQKFGDVVKREVKKAMNKFEADAKKNLAKAKAEVNKLDEKIAAAEKKLQSIEKQVAVKELLALQKDLAKKEWEKKLLMAQYPRRPIHSEGWRKVAAKNTEIFGIKTAIEALKLGKKIAVGTLKLVEELPREITENLKLKESALGGLKFAESNVKFINKATNAVVSAACTIEHATIKTSGDDLKKGKLPLLFIKINVPGIPPLDFTKRGIQLDLKRPDKIFTDIALQIKDSFKVEKRAIKG